ncbi:MAG: hypothetical protein AABY54_05810 [Deltaproteobacteria bacterium]
MSKPFHYNEIKIVVMHWKLYRHGIVLDRFLPYSVSKVTII